MQVICLHFHVWNSPTISHVLLYLGVPVHGTVRDEQQCFAFDSSEAAMAPHKLTSTLAAFTILQANFVSAYWREACSVSQMARLDPILDPGTISAHVHKFAGGISKFVGADSEVTF